MKLKPVIVTNNPLTKASLETKYEVIFNPDASLLDILITVRDYVHKGHRLLTHPLMGSIKPNQTPYKSVAVSRQCFDEIDLMSLNIIEDSILKAEQLIKSKKHLFIITEFLRILV
ncbi:GrdX family protein [Caloramator sp. mosi_1]|uniref:GrdX family protein n=1 Tax=Caloramator sp. mosi_1 TaxID=3023090 RepID=UPI0023622B21|nr:GrdX family protein [Caloramator sp. mosi_1]WDC84296.1 GrdX family protein [Caloramator sp. mosi_1]